MFKVGPKHEHLPKLLFAYEPSSVLIEHIEGCLQLLLAQQLLFVHGCHHKLRVVDLTRAINVYFIVDLV